MFRRKQRIFFLLFSFAGAIGFANLCGWWLRAYYVDYLPAGVMLLGVFSAAAWAYSASLALDTLAVPGIDWRYPQGHWANFFAALLTAMVAIVGLYCAVKAG